MGSSFISRYIPIKHELDTIQYASALECFLAFFEKTMLITKLLLPENGTADK